MNYKNRLLVIFFFISFGNIYCQDPGWEWAKSPGGSLSERVYAITTDVSGNVYSAGMFNSDTVNFGSVKLFNSVANHYWNMFVIKYDANGNILWATSANDSSGAYSVAADVSGNIYVTGWFASRSIAFGQVVLINKNYASFRNMFIVKYDSSGRVIWARSSGGRGHKYSNSASVDSSGNIYVAGYMYEYPWQAMFLMKYNSSGDLLWEKIVNSAIQANSIVADADGNVYVTGFSDRFYFTPDSAIISNKIRASSMFLTKYDKNGEVVWTVKPGGDSFSEGSAMTRDRFNNIYVTGYFTSDTLIFGSSIFISQNIEKMFVVKYDSKGKVVWANASEGDCCSWGNSVATDLNGNVYVTGAFSSNLVFFNSKAITNKSNTDIPFDDAFLLKYNRGGNLLWATGIYGNRTEESYVTANVAGNIYVAGYFGGDFVTFGNSTLKSTGNWDVFLAKLITDDGFIKPVKK